MLIAKPRFRSEYIPHLPAAPFSWLCAQLGPPERRAMREIARGGGLAEVAGRHYLVAPVSPATIDALAAFEAEGQGMENEPDEKVDEDGIDESAGDWHSESGGDAVPDN